MIDSSFPPPVIEVPSPTQKKHSKLGIVSFVLAIVSLLLICLFFVLSYTMSDSIGLPDPNAIANSSVGYTALALMCSIGLTTVVGVILGIIALTQKTQSKIYGILGLVINALILVGFCIVIIIGVALVYPSLP